MDILKLTVSYQDHQTIINHMTSNILPSPESLSAHTILFWKFIKTYWEVGQYGNLYCFVYDGSRKGSNDGELAADAY